MDVFTGSIVAFGFNFAPRGWAKCDGQLMAISQNSALFSLLGTMYGGDGRTTFGLPDLRGRTAIGAGTGPGMQGRSQGARGGTQSVTLNIGHMPSHTHAMHAETKPADSKNPNNAMLAITETNVYTAPDPVNNRVMAAESITATGGNQSFDNEGPYLAINWCICLYGIYPSRN